MTRLGLLEYSHIRLKTISAILTFCAYLQIGRCIILSIEKPINITEKLQKIGETVNDYKEALVAAFKDMEVEVRDWNFAVGKVEKQYNVEVNVKLSIKPKSE
jgi:hypothetical protein